MKHNLSKARNTAILVLFVLLINSQICSQSLLDPNARVVEIASNILQPEGPIWSDSLGLLFSDIKGNKIYKWTEENGKEVYMDPSDSTNGLTYDLQGRLIAGQMGKRRIVRFEFDGTQTSLADRFGGKKFNSPNDLVVKSDGSIFFTDPDFNIPGGPQNKELNFNGIYRISPEGNIQHLATLSLPNGICFSPDEKKIYVNDSQAHKIYVWDVIDDSTITNKQLFYTIPVYGYADGMKVDQEGNIYCTCSNFVWVISPEGEQLGRINLPAGNSASNCTWGGEDNKTLFITAGNKVFKINPLLTSISQQIISHPANFRLMQNYPNPFNPTTKIKFYIPKEGNIELVLYDYLGRKIKKLFSGIKSAGYCEIELNAQELSSGVYLYQLKAGGFVSIKKMVLLK